MNRRELETCIREHQVELFRYLRYLGADAARAEDLLQDVFMTAWTLDPPTGGHTGQAAWLRGIARNLMRRFVRKRAVKNALPLAEFDQAEAAWAAFYPAHGDDDAAVTALRQCLDRLTDDQRHLLDLRYRDDLSRLEMAQAAGLSEDGVKSALRRLRRALADCLKRRLHRETDA